jgi:SpoVK/Ycf46/Vps4 family AAA+-type ATPase
LQTLAPDLPKDRERGVPLVEVSTPELSWDRLVVSAKTSDHLHRIVEENRRSDLLAGYGLRPSQKVLFFGPPGCGKTLAAHVVASEMARPLVTVRFDGVVSSYLGETAANLRKVFDFVTSGWYVVLFDEFDAIGKDRDSPFEHGELKRVVNALLQMMDGLGGRSVLIAATNHEAMLDSGVWRRFDAVIRFRPPTQQDRIVMLRKFLGGFRVPAVVIDAAARRLSGATGSDLEMVALDAARRSALAGSTEINDVDLQGAVIRHQERMRDVAPAESPTVG